MGSSTQKILKTEKLPKLEGDGILAVRVFNRPVASGRHQGGPMKYKEGANFWKQILTDNFIVTQNSCKRLCFFAKKRRNSSSLMPRCVSSRMLGELDLPVAPLSLIVAVDRTVNA